MAEKLEPAAPRAADLGSARASGGAAPTGAPPGGGGAVAAGAADGTTAREAGAPVAAHSRSGTAFYVLGLSIQVLLWLLVFLAIAVAIATGGHLTEFRYVHF